MKKTLLACLVLVCAGACETTSAPPYTISAENVQLMRLRANAGRGELALGNVSESGKLRPITCREVRLDVTQGRSYSEYFRDAFGKELLFANAGATPIETIDVTIRRVKLNSMSGAWEIGVTVSGADGSTFDLDTKHAFKSSFVGSSACPMAGAAFAFAVQETIKGIVTHPTLND